MSPRIDHRPPLIAFVFLLVLAVAVIGTSARAGDGIVVSGGPLEVRPSVSGTATPVRPDSGERVGPVSRGDARPAPAQPSTARTRTLPDVSARHLARSSTALATSVHKAAKHRQRLLARIAVGRRLDQVGVRLGHQQRPLSEHDHPMG